MLIKTRNFSPGKQEKTFENDGFGWAPGQEKKFEGTEQRDNIRYGKNYQRMRGVCKRCENYTGVKTGTKGEHCSLPLNEGCPK